MRCENSIYSINTIVSLSFEHVREKVIATTPRADFGLLIYAYLSVMFESIPAFAVISIIMTIVNVVNTGSFFWKYT